MQRLKKNILFLIAAILLTCATSYSKSQNTFVEKTIRIQDSLKQDSLMKAEFYALITEIQSLQIDTINVIDAKANYKIIFVGDCLFSERYNQSFDEQWSKINNLDSVQKIDFAKLDIKY